MRRSQAPSLKTKILPNPKKVNDTPISHPGDNFKVVRTTESVLNLLSNSDSEISSTFDSPDPECFIKILNADDQAERQEPEREDVKTHESETSLILYNVVYGKQTKKKHKTWEGDGVLEIGPKTLTLKDENGKVIGTAAYPKNRKLQEGERIFIGSKEVELVDLVNERPCKIRKIEESENTHSNLVANPKIKTTLTGLKKRYIVPKINYSSGVVLPEPNAQHQWNFNQNGLPLTPVYIEPGLSSKLREHQQAGISFLYECIMGFKQSDLTGAILADEMGLGKTLQCIALIWTLLKQGPYGNKPVIRKALIVTPSSLTMNWYNEFIKWLGRVKLDPFVVNQKNRPSTMRGPVMIISYEMLVRYLEEVEVHNFDLLICDEGHRLKNSNIKTTQVLHRLNCPKRIILTGTPLQNDLQEFFALVDFVNPNHLGTPLEFRRRFEEPIVASRQPGADEEVIARGKECSQDLKRITSKFLLRRTRDILTDILPPRHEIAVFCKITDRQRELYNSVIDSYVGAKENIFGASDGCAHLEVITALRKICSHPAIFHKENFGKSPSEYVPAIQSSSKVLVIVNFLKQLKETSPKEKVVLVSNSTQTLDLLENILNSIGHSTCRLDGSTPAAQRNDIVERFNLSNGKAFVFLLSAKAGGVGLNLTGASRLVLFDSDWNPATDLQAIARIWRDGQKLPVFIYRLLTTGTIEEKIYQRQISKQGLCEGTVDPETAKSIKLSSEELKDIFSPCSVEEDCSTHNILSCSCSKQGEIPVPEVEPEERSCQLLRRTSSSLKMSELFHWEHHGRPFNSEFLSQLCLDRSEKEISFIFRNCRN